MGDLHKIPLEAVASLGQLRVVISLFLTSATFVAFPSGPALLWPCPALALVTPSQPYSESVVLAILTAVDVNYFICRSVCLLICQTVQ